MWSSLTNFTEIHLIDCVSWFKKLVSNNLIWYVSLVVNIFIETWKHLPELMKSNALDLEATSHHKASKHFETTSANRVSD